ncbi:hypothetical protein GXP67_04235 [Rhodocytophaga rosea]|uniref:HEAT repeat domain-containing protein n=1 Tax=Rhodocytophaga rosea TaxID=2704465 RepID=A0A6C0GDQ7_9BACT|nr:hypothetical protein [Rhodocytophaga rosea]QHT65933.1 hypothetical protein GXP67_04235 [Rhodocytophaga rosea]
MKFPLTAEQVKQEIYLSIDKNYYAGSLRYRQLKKTLLQAKHEIIVEGILQVFEDTSRGERNFVEQEFAGKLLYELKPDTRLTLMEVLYRTLPNYNLSVVELPMYLAEKYGLRAVAECLELLENQQNQLAAVLKSIKTFKFWLHIK